MAGRITPCRAHRRRLRPSVVVHRLWKSLRSLRWIGPDHEFEVWAEPPLIYLDHWAIRRLSEDAALGGRFLTAFGHRGTVMFSLMNVLEIARDLSVQRAAQIHAFLEALDCPKGNKVPDESS